MSAVMRKRQAKRASPEIVKRAEITYDAKSDTFIVPGLAMEDLEAQAWQLEAEMSVMYMALQPNGDEPIFRVDREHMAVAFLAMLDDVRGLYYDLRRVLKKGGE